MCRGCTHERERKERALDDMVYLIDVLHGDEELNRGILKGWYKRDESVNDMLMSAKRSYLHAVKMLTGYQEGHGYR